MSRSGFRSIKKMNHYRKKSTFYAGGFFYHKNFNFSVRYLHGFSPDPLYNKIIKEIVLWETKTNWEVTQ